MSRKKLSIKAKRKKSDSPKRSTNVVKSTKITADRKTRKRKLSSNRLVFGVFIVIVIVTLIGCGIGYYLNNIKMDEIPTDDEEVVELSKKYFRGTNACTDYNLHLFTDGKASAKDLDYNVKKEIAIEYAIRNDYNKISFNELAEIYKLLFNDGSNLEEKYYYKSTSGSYEKEGGVYALTKKSKCKSVRPPEMTCLVIDKAYKSNRNIKVITGLYSGTADTQYLYSGLNWDTEPLGLYGEITPSDQNLAKWEIVYKYDDKLGRYYLDYTKKL